MGVILLAGAQCSDAQAAHTGPAVAAEAPSHMHSPLTCTPPAAGFQSQGQLGLMQQPMLSQQSPALIQQSPYGSPLQAGGAFGQGVSAAGEGVS